MRLAAGTVRNQRLTVLRAGMPAGLAALVATACGGGHPSASSTTRSTTAPSTSSSTSSSTTTTSTSTTTTVPLKTTTGSITVLSPIGLNVRGGPSKTAKVLGSAAQGAVLSLLGQTSAAGGWYRVQGATVTGWVSSDPTYSAKGLYAFYVAPAFSVLYPSAWREEGAPSSGVTFSAPSPGEHVVLRTAAHLAKLPTVHEGAGVSLADEQQEVACGVTGHLYLYDTPKADRYLANFNVAADAHHALGLMAVLTSRAQLSTVRNFINSISFPLPVCVGGPPPKHAKATPTTKVPKRTSSPAPATAPTT